MKVSETTPFLFPTPKSSPYKIATPVTYFREPWLSRIQQKNLQSPEKFQLPLIFMKRTIYNWLRWNIFPSLKLTLEIEGQRNFSNNFMTIYLPEASNKWLW